MASRPQVSVQGSNATLKMPAVMVAPIRSDIVQFVHTNMNKNARQAYGVFQRAGMGHSAVSWGTGRAVSRIPRVSGGGTSRAGQGAFGNMCRKGRMFNPTVVHRRWHRPVNQNQKRYAVASALAASALPALVMARGHQVSNVPEFPLVLDNAAGALTKTKAAVELLKTVGAYDDIEKAKNSHHIRTGVGKMRNRRFTSRKGPLLVFAEGQDDCARAFRNLSGVDCAHVDRLNLLQLAPGGHLGRFIIWTADAFKRLNEVYGSETRVSSVKSGYKLPRNIMSNSDLTRIINSDEVQAKVNAPKDAPRRAHNRQKKNPLKNFGVMVRLNPYAAVQKRARILASKTKTRTSTRNKKHKEVQKANFARLSA